MFWLLPKTILEPYNNCLSVKWQHEKQLPTDLEYVVSR